MELSPDEEQVARLPEEERKVKNEQWEVHFDLS